MDQAPPDLGTKPIGPAGAAEAVGRVPSRPGLAFNNIGAVYVWLAIVVVFSIWVPETFPTISTVKQT